MAGILLAYAATRTSGSGTAPSADKPQQLGLTN